jgi:RND family efflux transporter MFP subunit
MTRSTSAVFLLLALGFAAGCKKPDAPQSSGAKAEPPVKAETLKVTEEPMPEYLTLTGTLKASQESEVAADAAGRVTATFVERGQRVKAGDTLAVLDARGASISASAATAQTQLAKAQLEQAQRECDRVKSLKDTGAISPAEYDRVVSQCQTTQWAAAAAQAQQQNAQKLVGDTVIRAPFSGTVGERFINVGQYVQAQTHVVSLYAPDPLRLELTVPEANLGGLRPEQPITFSVSAYPEGNFPGVVKLISPNVRATTRDLVVEAFCPNVDGKLKPGMFAVARLELGEKPAIVVPSKVLLKDASTTRAFKVVNKRIEEQIVQTGAERDGKTTVLVGLKVGDEVVAAPRPDLRDGALVQ